MLTDIHPVSLYYELPEFTFQFEYNRNLYTAKLDHGWNVQTINGMDAKRAMPENYEYQLSDYYRQFRDGFSDARDGLHVADGPFGEGPYADGAFSFFYLCEETRETMDAYAEALGKVQGLGYCHFPPWSEAHALYKIGAGSYGHPETLAL